MHLFERVRRRIPLLAGLMVEAFLDEVPFYRRLPREQLDGEITAICADNLRVFFATLVEDRLPTEDELAEPRSSAGRRAQERVPLDAVLTAYHVGGRVGWDALVASARPDETAELVAAAYGVQRYVQAVTGVVAAAYLEEQQAIHGEERDARRALVAALLAGEPADVPAARLGVRLPNAWTVVALELGEHPDESAAGVTGAVAGRRKVRRVETRLAELVGDPVLGSLEPAGGVVLLPAPDAATPELVEAIRGAAGADVRAGAATAHSRAGLVPAGAQAREVLRLAGALGRPPGRYVLGDVLLEYQLTRPGDALPLLAGLLDPLNDDLVRSVATYLAADLDRRRTAAALHVHPNTLDYRLKRVADLTGLDVATTRGLALLTAAVTARQAAG